jgi:hypothetical protein
MECAGFRPFVPRVMAVRYLGEPSSYCAGFTAHSKYAMGLGPTEWAVKPTQWLLGSPKFLTAISLGTSGLYPACSITVFVIYTMGMWILNND